MLVAVQVSVPGLYLPPVLNSTDCRLPPPQTIISLPVQTALCRYRATGALVVLVAAQLSVSRIVAPASVENAAGALSAPDDHLAAGPNCRVIDLAPSGALVVLVAVQVSVLGSYLPPVFKYWCCRHTSAPDDHFTAGPNCRVIVPCLGRVGGAGSCPAISAGIVSPASVEKVAGVVSAPDDHLAAGPNCRVEVSRLGRIGGTGDGPAISAGIVSPASVHIAAAVISAPDDHLTAGPHCRVIVSRHRAHWSMLVAAQLSVLGLYLPPVFDTCASATIPPHSIISLPVQTAT